MDEEALELEQREGLGETRTDPGSPGDARCETVGPGEIRARLPEAPGDALMTGGGA